MKIIKVGSCGECPYKRNLIKYVKGIRQWFVYCGRSTRDIIDKNSIPDWCPLEDLGKFVSIKEGKKCKNQQ